MHIEELAEGAGVPAKTIRYYEAVGLLPTPARSPNGYRAYGQADLTRLLLIKHLRLAGVGLPELRDIVAVAGSSSCSTVRTRLLPALDARLADMDRQFAELTALRADLCRYRDDLRASIEGRAVLHVRPRHLRLPRGPACLTRPSGRCSRCWPTPPRR